eukprot:gene10051-13511_t
MNIQQEDFYISRLESSNKLEVIFGLSLLYSVEFLKVYLSPIITKLLSILWKAIDPMKANTILNKNNDDKVYQRKRDTEILLRDDDISDSVIDHSGTNPSILISTSVAYRTVKDDKKATVGSENDIFMLKHHKYNKYRFVSNEFIVRNKLIKPKDKN